MTSFHDIFNFLWNPITEAVLMVIFLACAYLWLSRMEMRKAVILIPALPWLAGWGMMLYAWSQSDWITNAPINAYGFLDVITNFLAEAAAGNNSLPIPGWYEFLFYVMLLGLLANAGLFLYTSLVRWPVQKAKEELEAAVGRETGRRVGARSSAFVGETGMEPSAPVSALLNRRPGSRLGQTVEGNPLLTKSRTQSDADRVAAMQAEVLASAAAAAPTAAPAVPSAAAVASPGGAAGTTAGDSTRLAQLINSIQSDTPSPMRAPAALGHCTKCGVALAQPDHHVCPVPGGDNMFCGNCGAPHEPRARQCAACQAPLSAG